MNPAAKNHNVQHHALESQKFIGQTLIWMYLYRCQWMQTEYTDYST